MKKQIKHTKILMIMYVIAAFFASLLVGYGYTTGILNGAFSHVAIALLFSSKAIALLYI